MNARTSAGLARRLSIAGAIIAVLLIAAFALPVRDWLGEMSAWINWHREIAWLAFIGAYVLACILLLPGLVLTLAACAIFGLAWGISLVSLSSVLGATAAFFIGRTVARDWVARRVESLPRFRALDRALAEKGFLIVMLTRLFSLFPFNLLNYAYGVTGVRARDYVVASWPGMLPATIAVAILVTRTASRTLDKELRAG